MGTKKMKRMLCAGLAAQMMLSSVAQAADPLHTLFVSARGTSASERTILEAKTDNEIGNKTLTLHDSDLKFAPLELLRKGSGEASAEGEGEGAVSSSIQAAVDAMEGQIVDLPSDGETPADTLSNEEEEAPKETTGPDDFQSSGEGEDLPVQVPGDDTVSPPSGENGEGSEEELPAPPSEGQTPSEPLPAEPSDEPQDPIEETPVDGEIFDTEAPSYFAVEADGQEPAEANDPPAEPVVNYLLKIDGYGSKYNYSGDGTSWVQGVSPDYNVEQAEPWVLNTNFDYTGGIWTQLLEPATEVDESQNIWSGIEFPEDFNAYDNTTWPEWFSCFIYDCDYDKVFYDLSREDTWPTVDQIPDEFVKTPAGEPPANHLWPGLSSGKEVWKPDDTFLWNGEEGKTYLSLNALSTPRVPNKKLENWYIAEDANRSQERFGPADEPYGKYEDTTTGDDINPYVNGYGGSRKTGYQHEQEVYVYDPELGKYDPFDPSKPLDDYVNYMSPQKVFAIIGNWIDSDNATATNLVLAPAGEGNATIALYPYEKDIETLTAAELAAKTAIDEQEDFTAVTSHEFFARVPYETDKIGFFLYTYEPGSTLEITATNSGGQAVSFTAYVDQDGETKKLVNNDHYPDNSFENPARGIRSLKEMSIPLTVTKTQLFTTIKMTVTAPDGKATETYAVYVQRLDQPTMEVSPGNTPMGMIERTPGWSDEKKTEARAYFMGHNSFNSSVAGNLPNDGSDMANDGINNGGYVYTGIYTPEAWGHGGTNYDNVAGAIVAYQNTTLKMPGFTVYDSLGNPHTEGEEGLAMKWNLTLTLVDKLTPAAAVDTPQSPIGTASHSWSGEGTVGEISLHGQAVKPGVYTMSYTYTDPYDDNDHSEAELGFTRTVIILPLRGDVDMDGEVTSADGVMLQQLLASGYFGTRNDMLACTDVTKCLYYFRVCDVNGDQYIDDRDTQELIAEFDTPTYGRTIASRDYYYYLPLLDPAKDENRVEPKKATTGTAAEGQANLVVEYLGLSDDLSNMTKLNTEARLDFDPTNTAYPGVFWIGVKLTGAEYLPESLQAPLTTFTFTLAYDSAYAEPWSPTSSQWTDYIKTVNPQWNWDAYKLQSSSDIGISPVPHDGKATSGLAAEESKLRELRFSVAGSGIGLADLPEGYVLKIPFKLTAYPRLRMDEAEDASLVEAALGMRNLTLTTEKDISEGLPYSVKASAVWRNQSNLSDMVNTTTINLADQVTYVNQDAVIPIGENKAPSVGILVNGRYAVYGETFSVDLTNTVDGSGNEVHLGTPVRLEDDGHLAETGLTFNFTTRVLSGTPTRTWSEKDPLTFYVVTQGGNEYPFKLVVDKAPLTLTVHDVDKYYGETSTTEKMFTYDAAQIKFDSEGGKQNTGAAADLPNLLTGYTAPTISLVESLDNDAEAITATTVPGKYVVMLSGGESTNYRFQYARVETDDSGDPIIDPSKGSAVLTIRPRPVIVDKITRKDENGIAITLGTLTAGGVNAVEGKDVSFRKGEFTTSAVELTNGLYLGIPLTTSVVVVGEDELTLKYTAHVANFQNPNGASEDMAARIDRMELMPAGEDNDNNCYTLVGTIPRDVTGLITVLRQKLLRVEVPSQPSTYVFNYGAPFNPDRFVVNLYYDENRDEHGNMVASQIGGDGGWSQDSIASYYTYNGLTLQWVDKVYGEEETFPTDALDAYRNQIMTVAEQNGKYLCLSLPGVDETTKEDKVFRMYFGPYTVNPKVLTLTMQESHRYYGESSTDWDVTFSRDDLTLEDQAMLTTNRGNRADLKRILGENYVEPTVECRTGTTLVSNEVNEKTGVGKYYLLLTGGETGDYTFRYVCTDLNGVTTTTATADAPGYAPLEIHPRPILVTKITAPVVELSYDSPMPAASRDYTSTVSQAESKNEFSAELPTYLNSYYKSDMNGPVEETIRYKLTQNAICSWDKVSVQYRAESIETHNAASPWWNLDGEESIEIKVEVRMLSLADNNANYLLLYGNSTAAGSRYTATVEGERTSAMGTVSLRKATKVEIIPTSLPTLNYTYGDTFNFNNFTVRIWYAGQEDGAGTTLRYGELSDPSYPNTFRREGLEVYWQNDDGTLGDQVTQGQQLSVSGNNGKRIVVADAGTKTARATVTTAVTVNKKPLQLTVQDQRRIYGEDNAPYVAELSVSQLASWDRTALIQAGKITEDTDKTTSANLATLDSSYSAPTFTTAAAKTTGVGSYDLTMSVAEVNMTNYALSAAPGKITIEKRRIQVDSIKKNPVYSVSQNAKVLTITDVLLYQGKAEDGTVYDHMAMRPVGYSGMTPTNTTAVLEGDLVAVSMSVTFTSTAAITSSAAVTIRPDSFQLIQGTENYELVTTGQPISATGAVHQRKVASVAVTQAMTATYIYGAPLDLSQLQVRLSYEKEPGETDADVASELVNYGDFASKGISLQYWSSTEIPATKEGWLAAATGDHPAASGDHLTRVPDGDGFAHNGKYLLISVETTPGSGEYIRPLLYENYQTHRPISLTVNQRELSYTVSANNKPYDRTTKATGTLTLLTTGDHGVYPGDDVRVDASKLSFQFTSVNAGENIPVEVRGITLLGEDADNYHINAELLVTTPVEYGRPPVPRADITPNTERPTPDVRITLSIDPHTNTVKVDTDRQATYFPEGVYEYALVGRDGGIIAPYQKSPYFGGEQVLIGGVRQNPMAGDRDFGNRDALPRGTYVGALVRLAATNNYTASSPVHSYKDFDTAVTEAEDGLPQVPADEKERIVERRSGSVIKTYTYRFDMISTEEQKNSEGKTTYVTRLDAVWFTDISSLENEKALSRLVDNLATTRYTAFAWDPALKVKLNYPMDLTQPIMANLPTEQEDGTTVTEEVQVNTDDILPIYVTARRRGDGGGSSLISPQKVKIQPDALTLLTGDLPFQLELVFEPEKVTDRQVVWTSSDETVVTVSEDGVVTVVGPGTAVITVTTWNRRTDSITVQVLEGYDVPYRDSMFNANYQGSYMELTDGLFEPERRLTRWELTVIMEHFFQQVQARQPSQPDQFLDVSWEDLYMDQIHTLNIWGIVNGVGENRYAPNRYATRAEISAILCRMLMLPINWDPEAPHAFIDAGPEDTWAWAYIDALAEAGITLGTGDDMYSPNRILTRAEVATMISRILITDVDIERPELIRPIDVTEGHWAYRHILRAVNGGAVLLVKTRYRKK